MLRAKQIELQKLGHKLTGPFILAFAVFYLVFHSLSGERGIYALLKEDRELEVLQTQLAQVKAERQTLEHRVRLMSSDSLDLDLLDEQSRELLGVSGKDEMVIPVMPKKADDR